jgi:predicted HTH domain antitoxin
LEPNAADHCFIKKVVMALVITDEVLQKTNLSEKELLTDIACYLYEKKKLSMGKAKELAGLNQLQFQAALAEREIDIHYSITDLQQDLDNLKIELDIK